MTHNIISKPKRCSVYGCDRPVVGTETKTWAVNGMTGIGFYPYCADHPPPAETPRRRA